MLLHGARDLKGGTHYGRSIGPAPNCIWDRGCVHITASLAAVLGSGDIWEGVIGEDFELQKHVVE